MTARRLAFVACVAALVLPGACAPVRETEGVGAATARLTSQLTIDPAALAGPLDLSPYSLGQGGLSSEVMIDGHLPELTDLHPKTIRFFIQEYFDLYPAHGVYNWTKLDAFLSAAVATGARPIANIDFKPAALYPMVDQRIVDPTSYQEWEELVYQLVVHCQQKGYGIQYWEIGNEGDIGESGGCPYLFTPQNYLPYYSHTASAIRRADPAAKVGGPALANPGDPIGDALIDYCGTGNAPLDFFSWHGYSNDVGSFRGSIQSIRGKLGRYASLQQTETLISEWNVDLSSPGLDPHFQPAFIIEMTRMFHEEGLSGSAYYQIRDHHVDESEFLPFMSQGGADFMAWWWNTKPQYDGIWDFDGNVRPSYYAFRWLGQLTGTRVLATGETGEVRTLAARDGNTLRAIVYNYSGTGSSYDLTVNMPSTGDGGFELLRLDTAPAVNVATVRTGSAAELATNPIQITLAPFQAYLLTASVKNAPPSPGVFTGQVPTKPDWNDGEAHELGTRLAVTQPGQVTALRYYKAPSETGAHTGHLWSSSGAALATVAFVAESASGWQQAALATPVTLEPGAVYTVSVNSNTFYVASNGALAEPVINGPLRTVADGANGVYGPPGAFPTQSFESTNYFRDVAYTPTP